MTDEDRENAKFRLSKMDENGKGVTIMVAIFLILVIGQWIS